MTRIAILDYGMGNLRSVGKALEHVGAEPFLTSDHARVREADGIVLPGVGAMPKAMERVRELALDQLLRERVEASVPVIGLCMGMQLLFESTTELGGADGIGLLPGPVQELDAPGLKIPQIGWNQLQVVKPECPLLRGVSSGSYVYFVHSFFPRPEDPSIVATRTTYGETFASAIWRGNIFATQFHPEKSQKVGLQLLKNFVDYANGKRA